VKFLSPGLRLAALEPLLLARESPDPARWKWPKAAARQKEQYLKLFRSWCAARRFCLVRSGLPLWKVGTVFNVWKSTWQDRQIIDRRGPNGGECKVDCDPSDTLAAGWQFVDILLKRGKNLYLSASDLKHYYHAWVVSLERGRSNAVGPVLSEEEVAALPGDPLGALHEDENDEFTSGRVCSQADSSRTRSAKGGFHGAFLGLPQG